MKTRSKLPSFVLAATLALAAQFCASNQQGMAASPNEREPEDTTTLAEPIRSIEIHPLKLAQHTQSETKADKDSAAKGFGQSQTGKDSANRTARSPIGASAKAGPASQKTPADSVKTAASPNSSATASEAVKPNSDKSQEAQPSTTDSQLQPSDDSAVAGSPSSKTEILENSESQLHTPEKADPSQEALSGAAVSQTGNLALEHFDLARNYFSHWQLALAEAELEITIMYAPNMKIAHRDYSIVSLLRGHPIRACAEALMTVGICEAVPLNESERKDLLQRVSQVHYREALALARKTQWDAAIAELMWAQRYAPGKASILRSLAFCYASKGDFTRAEQQYNLCVAVDPDDAFARADFSYLLAEHGQQDRAESQLLQAIKVAPRVAALHVDMGWLSETKGDFDTAQQELEKAIKLCPKQPGLWLQLGKVLERAGKTAEAKKAYGHVLAIDSSETEAKQHLDALESASGDEKSDTQPTVKSQS